jgi:hypothetical protein
MQIFHVAMNEGCMPEEKRQAWLGQSLVMAFRFIDTRNQKLFSDFDYNGAHVLIATNSVPEHHSFPLG